jgi:hypothetical protein
MSFKRGSFHNTTPAAQQAAAKRGGLKVSPKYVVEGAYVSMNEIAARLEVHATTARERLKAAQKLPGPVTWERLGAK